jgi:hypothetical protein
MKTRLWLFVLLLISAGAPIAANAQGEKKPRTESDYRVRTLSELTTLQPNYMADKPQLKDESLRIIVHADPLPSRVKVFFDGTSRPVTENRKQVITQWANSYAGAPEFYPRPYETEMLFTEDGKNYWLAVKKEFIPRFDKDLKKGEGVELFLIKLGNTRMDDKLEPVILVEKFVKQ